MEGCFVLILENISGQHKKDTSTLSFGRGLL
jgi:hypothetical protein